MESDVICSQHEGLLAVRDGVGDHGSQWGGGPHALPGQSYVFNLRLVFPSLQDHGLMIAAYESGLWVRWKFPKNPSLQQIRGSTRQFDFMVGKENKRQILCIIILWFARFGGTPAFLWAELRANSSWLKMAISLQTNSRKILSSTWPKFQLRWAHSFLHCGCAVHVTF